MKILQFILTSDDTCHIHWKISTSERECEVVFGVVIAIVMFSVTNGQLKVKNAGQKTHNT